MGKMNKLCFNIDYDRIFSNYEFTELKAFYL